MPGVRGHRSAHEPENLTNGRVRGQGRMFKQTFKGQQQNVISLLTLIRSSLPVFSPFQVPFLCTLMQPCCFSIGIYWSNSFLSWWVLTVSEFCSFRCWRSKARAPWWVIHTLQVSTTSLKCILWKLRFVRHLFQWEDYTPPPGRTIQNDIRTVSLGQVYKQPFRV